MLYRLYRLAVPTLLMMSSAVFVLLPGCGGGGGGGGDSGGSGNSSSTANVQPLTPSANAVPIAATNALKVASNAEELIAFGQLWIDPDTSTINNVSSSSTGQPLALSTGLLPNGTRVAALGLTNSSRSVLSQSPASACDSGNITLAVLSSDTANTVTIQLAYNSCLSSGVLGNGSITLATHFVQQGSSFVPDTRKLTYDSYRLTSAGADYQYDGTINLSYNSDRTQKNFLTNVTIQNLLTGTSIAGQDLSTSIANGKLFATNSYLYTAVGRVIFSDLGDVVFNKTSLSSPQLVILGKNSGDITVTAATVASVAVRQFAVDLDGDGTIDRYINIPWSLFYPSEDANNPPVANAGPDQTITAGGSATLDGRNSTDADYNPLAFSWTLQSAPAGGHASLGTANSPTTTFTADIAGDYQILLTVDDGAHQNSDVVIISVR